MEIITECLICRGKSLQEYRKAKDYLVSNKQFTITQCKQCGFVFTNPRPDDQNLGQYYISEEYISHHDSGSSLTQRLYQAVRRYMLSYKVKLIQKHLMTNSTPFLFDYGCGTGEFLRKIRKMGWQTGGLEPSEQGRERAVSKGLHIYANEDEMRSNLPNESIDVITLWHVLEHISDPVAKAKFFFSLLKEDGLIVVAVPEYKSYDSRYYDEEWAALDVPRHLNHFDENSITSIFSQVGFVFEKSYPLIFDAFYIALLSEKHRGQKGLPIFNAFRIGLLSNYYAWKGKYPYSSMIYVFRKPA